MSALRKNLRRLRAQAGLTPAQLSRAAGVASVRMIERRGAARIETIEKLAKALGVDVSDLFATPPRRKKAS